MHINLSQYNYILHGLPDVTSQSTQHPVILYGLWEVTSEGQVISHDPSERQWYYWSKMAGNAKHTLII